MKRILSTLNTTLKTAKCIITVILSCAITTSFATLKTTVADGNWFNPAGWSPAGVPLIEDTVIVNHHMDALGDKVEFGASWLIVTTNGSIFCDSIFALHGSLYLDGTMNVKRYADGDGDSTLIYGELNATSISPSNPVAFNYGSISSDTLVIGEAFHNYGLIETDFMTAGGGSSVPFVNYSLASIVVSDTAIFSTETINELNAEMTLGYLMTDILITNNGSIACTNWTHLDGIANGTGTYCVEECFQNFADIQGSPDICDASPGGFCDWNFGTIAGTVTTCAGSPCTSSVSIDESTEEVSLYPNPAVSCIMLKEVVIGSLWTILDFSGKKIASGTVTTDLTQIDVSEFPAGVYVLMVQNQNTSSINRFVKD